MHPGSRAKDAGDIVANFIAREYRTTSYQFILLFPPNCPDCLIATSFTSILISSRPFGQSPGLFKCACRRVSPHLSRMNSFSSITTFSFRLSFRSTAYISYRFRRDRDHWGILYHYFSWRVLSPRNHPCWFPSPWPPAHALPSAPP